MVSSVVCAYHINYSYVLWRSSHPYCSKIISIACSGYSCRQNAFALDHEHWHFDGSIWLRFSLIQKGRNIFKFSIMQYTSPSNASCILTSFYNWKLYIGPIVFLISVLKVELYVNGDWIRFEQIFSTVLLSIHK